MENNFVEIALRNDPINWIMTNRNEQKNFHYKEQSDAIREECLKKTVNGVDDRSLEIPRENLVWL